MAESLSVSDIIGEMTPALKSCYDQVCTLMTSVQQGNITARYKTGVIVADALDSTDTQLYGKGAASRLASALNIQKQELYRCKVFASTYTSKEVKKLLTRRTPSGRRITWSHLDALIRIEQPGLRRKLLDRVFAEDLNTRELQRIIKEKCGKRGNGKGRPKASPKTVHGLLAVLDKKFKDILDFYPVATEKLNEAIGTPAEHLFDGYHEYVNSLADQKAAVVEAVKTITNQCQTLELTFNKVGRLKKNTEAAETEMASVKRKPKLKLPPPKAKKPIPTLLKLRGKKH